MMAKTKKVLLSLLVAITFLATCLFSLNLFNKTYAESVNFDFSNVGGISIKGKGETTGTSNTSIIVNLPEPTSLADVKSIILEATLDTDDGIAPFIIDTDGDYYELMGADNISNGTYKRARTLQGLTSASNEGIGAWFSFSPKHDNGYSGKGFYSLRLQDYYARVNFNNYGSSSLEGRPNKGAVLTNEQMIRAIGYRIGADNYTHANVVMGDVYLEYQNGTIEKVIESSSVKLSANLGYTWDVNAAWLGYIGNFGSTTSLGWITPAEPSAVDVTVREDNIASYFNGINVKHTFKDTETTDNNKYQRIVIPAYEEDLTDKVISIEYFDRSLEGYCFEPKLRANGTEYGLTNATIYFVDANYNLLGTNKHSWSVTPPKGFVGYVLIDLSTVTNASYLELETHTNESLMLGFHSNWNAGHYDADFGQIKVLDGNMSASPDFESLINNGEVYYDFASNTSLDGLNAFSVSGEKSYALVIGRVMKSYDFKNSSEVLYGRLDGINFKISDPEDQTYHYLYVKGNSSDVSNMDYFSIRIADHAYNDGLFEFFFYDKNQTFDTRSGISQENQAFLFNKDGSFNKAIYPENAWSWVKIPMGFDGYLVVPTTSINWLIDKTNAVYATFISQGSQGISNNQQGTLDTPTSSGFNIEFGQMKVLSGTLDADKTNFNELLNNGVVYAETLSASRNGFSANVSGATHLFTPVVGSNIEYSYMPVEGIVLDATEVAGNVTINSVIDQNAERLAIYVYNESMESLEIAVSFDNGAYPEKATLLSVIDEEYNYNLTDGKISLPDGFEGYLIVDYKGGKPIITLDKGERLGITDIFSLVKGITVANANEVFNKSATVFRTVTATDTAITEAFTADGLTIKRSVNSYYTTPDAPSNFEDESVVAKVELLDEDNYIFNAKANYAIYKSEEMYEGTPTLNFNLAPTLIKESKKYVMYDQGETVNLKVTESGVIYVFAAKDFECDGFKKTMAMESFFDGIDGRVFCYKKDAVKDEVLAIDGAYLIIIDGEVSPSIWTTVPYKQMFFFGNEHLEEIEIYKHNVGPFYGAPSFEKAGNRLFSAGITGGRTEPVIENVLTTYVSEDEGLTWIPYSVCDHPYETMGRVFDTRYWYVDGRLWAIASVANETFDDVCTWTMYSDNADTANNIEDIVWSEPAYFIGGLLNGKPIKLSNGDYIYSSYYPAWNGSTGATKQGVCNIYISKDQGLTSELVGQSMPQPGVNYVFLESVIVELKNGALSLLKRTEGNGDNIYTEECFSIDGGKTWTMGQYNTALRCGGARFVYTRLASGNLLFVGCKGANRSKMTAYLSEDDGATWPYSLELDHREWVSYPDHAQMEDGSIIVQYDKGRTTELEIRQARFTEEDIKAGRLVSEDSYIMYPALKGSKYKEITKVFALPETEFDEVSGQNVVKFASNATRSDILKVFPSDGISVGLNNGDLMQILGSWTLGRIDADGYATVTFVPSTPLNWDLADNYRLFEVKIKLESPITLTGIEITSNPTKTTYKIGERLDVTGLVVKEVYSDTTKVEITDYTVSELDSSTAGTKTITVTKGNFSDTFTVTVESDETPNSPSDTPSETPSENKGGCGSTVEAIGLIGLLGVALSTTLLKKKKR